MEEAHTLKFYRRNLPHWLVAGESYFVTIRLKNSLPKNLVETMRMEREQFLSANPDKEQISRLRNEQFLKIEAILDALDAKVRYLDNPSVARIVMDSLGWLHQRGWKMYAAVLLTTHIHLLMHSENERSKYLLEDLGQFKNYTARESNRVLKRKGNFWAREEFDHWVRTPEKFEAIVRYIAMNPVKAGRVKKWQDWECTLIDESVRYCLEK